MGAGNTKMSNKISLTTINETINEKMSSIQTRNESNQENVQYISITDSNFVNCKPDVSNTATVNQAVIQDIDDQDRTELINSIDATLKQKAGNDANVERGALSFDFGNQDIKNKQSTKIKNLLTNKITLSKLNELIADQRNDQTIEIEQGTKFNPCEIEGEMNKEVMAILAADPDNEGLQKLAKKSMTSASACAARPCNVENNAAVSQVSQQIAKIVVDTLLEADLVSYADVEQKNKASVKIKGLLAFLENPMFLIICAIVIIVCLFLFVSMKKQKTEVIGQAMAAQGGR